MRAALSLSLQIKRQTPNPQTPYQDTTAGGVCRLPSHMLTIISLMICAEGRTPHSTKRTTLNTQPLTILIPALLDSLMALKKSALGDFT